MFYVGRGAVRRHHAQSVIYLMLVHALYVVPRWGNLDTHANCVKGECGVGNTPRTGHGLIIIPQISMLFPACPGAGLLP